MNFSMSTEPIYTLLTQHMLSVVPALAAASKEPYTTIKALKHYNFNIPLRTYTPSRLDNFNIL